MLKEIKYLVFIVIISIFIFFTGRYYFSDENIKNSYRSYKNIDEKVKIYSKKLPLLKMIQKILLNMWNKQTKKRRKNSIFGNF